MDIKILVATHKKYWMPEDEVYLPIHVGREGKQDLGYIGDNTGDNISSKNANYCELTGLYWAWKNLDCEYIGLCHYRRYFAHIASDLDSIPRDKNIFGEKGFCKILRKYDIVLPKKYKYKNSYMRKQYEIDHHKKDLDETERVLKELYPEYYDSFLSYMDRSEGFFLNMFVMKKTLFDEYCKWLFDILFELEKRVDISDYDTYQARIFGFLSERLFNVWLSQQNLKVFEANILALENTKPQHFWVCWSRYIREKIRLACV